jgi:hypothetical protein
MEIQMSEDNNTDETRDATKDATKDTTPTLPVAWEPTHRHVGRGTEYEVLGKGKVQTGSPLSDYDEVVIYKGSDGNIWVRLVHEFEETGRFEAIARKVVA